MATLDGRGLAVRKAAGKIATLEALIAADPPVPATLGIAHTRWATHGRPSDGNAHPHVDCESRLAIVHNGIIENYRELRQWLSAKGHRFRSQTDTEVIAHSDARSTSALRTAREWGSQVVAIWRRRGPAQCCG